MLLLPAVAKQLIASLLVYLFGLIFTSNFVLIFIVTVILLAADFYYLKNIAGRRLVGLRWWNEVDQNTGDSHWVFESADPETRQQNSTDKRFFWLAVYAQPVLWVLLAIVAVVKIEPIWLTLVGEWMIPELPTSIRMALMRNSYRPDINGNEYGCIFSMRQVQSSHKSCV